MANHNDTRSISLGSALSNTDAETASSSRSILSSTPTTYTTILLPITTPTATPKASRWPCLYTRMLHEKCGHVLTLYIHELPCTRSYLGWISSPRGASTAPVHDPGMGCDRLDTHITISRSRCKECATNLEVDENGRKKEGSWFGWRKDKAKGKEREDGKKRWSTLSVSGREGSGEVSVAELVRRRTEWKREIDLRKSRRQEKQMSEWRAKEERVEEERRGWIEQSQGHVD